MKERTKKETQTMFIKLHVFVSCIQKVLNTLEKAVKIKTLRVELLFESSKIITTFFYAASL